MMPDTTQSRRALTCLYIYIFMYCNPLVKKEEEDHVAHEPARPCLSVCLCCQCILKIVHFPFHFSSISKELFSVGTTCDDYCDNGQTRLDDGLIASHFSQVLHEVEDSVYRIFWLIGWCRSWPGPWRNWKKKINY